MSALRIRENENEASSSDNDGNEGDSESDDELKTERKREVCLVKNNICISLFGVERRICVVGEAIYELARAGAYCRFRGEFSDYTKLCRGYCICNASGFFRVAN